MTPIISYINNDDAIVNSKTIVCILMGHNLSTIKLSSSNETEYTSLEEAQSFKKTRLYGSLAPNILIVSKCGTPTIDIVNAIHTYLCMEYVPHLWHVCTKGFKKILKKKKFEGDNNPTLNEVYLISERASIINEPQRADEINKRILEYVCSKGTNKTVSELGVLFHRTLMYISSVQKANVGMRRSYFPLLFDGSILSVIAMTQAISSTGGFSSSGTLLYEYMELMNRDKVWETINPTHTIVVFVNSPWKSRYKYIMKNYKDTIVGEKQFLDTAVDNAIQDFLKSEDTIYFNTFENKEISINNRHGIAIYTINDPEKLIQGESSSLNTQLRDHIIKINNIICKRMNIKPIQPPSLNQLSSEHIEINVEEKKNKEKKKKKKN